MTTTEKKSDFDDDIFDKLVDDIVSEGKELVATEVFIPPVIEPSKEIAISSEDITKELLDMTHEDREQASAVFDMFYGKLSTGKDFTSASKEFLVKALEVKVSSSKNLIDLLKTMKQEKENKVGVFVNSVSAMSEGIDIKKLQENV
jgi:hypothetical protein